MAARKLAFVNFKGGVAKTSDTVNIAAVLACHADFAGVRVLVVDLDPQCNASLWLLKRRGWNICREEGRTIRSLFKPRIIADDVDIRTLITPVPGVPASARLDILAGDFAMLEVDDEGVPGLSRFQAEEVLCQALTSVQDEYEYILFDCPPGFSLPTRNAFRAADYVIVPYTPDYLALEGIKWIRHLQSGFAARHGWEKTASLFGVIINRYNESYRAQVQAIAELFDTLDALQSVLEPQRYNGLVHLFEPFIPERTAMNEANNNQQLLVLHKPDDSITKAFVQLTKTIAEAISAAV